MAKKRKDLSGQLDGLFAGFDSEEEVESKEEGQVEPALIEGPQAIDELIAGEPAAEQAEPATEQAEMPQVPAIDALLAAEPSITETVEEEQALPALAEEPAIDALLAAEPVELPEEEAPAEEQALVEPVEVPEPVAIEKVEPELLEAVEPPVVGVVEPEPVVELPTMAELLAVEVAPEPAAVEAEQIEAEIAEQAEPAPVELPSLAELLAAEEVEPEPEVVEVFAPSIAEPVARVSAAESEGVEREKAVPAIDARAAIDEQRRKILDTMLLSVTIIGGLFAILPLVLEGLQGPDRLVRNLPYFAAYGLLAVIAFARRLNATFRTATLLALAYGLGTFILLRGGRQSTGGLYLLVAPLLVSILVRRIDIVPTMLSAGLSTIIYAVVVFAQYMGWIDTLEFEAVRVDVEQLSSTVNAIGTFAMLAVGAALIQQVFNAVLTNALREAESGRDEVASSQVLLEQRASELAATNTALRRRTLQLETASLVSQTASSELDPDELMQQVVDLIRERFDLYHVGLFLVSETNVSNGAEASQHELLLRAGTGVAGRWMLAQSHSVEIGDDSAVGQCAARGQAQTKQRLDQESVGFAGDLLPQTRSEIALPLRSRGRVLGALDVHSVEREAFSHEDAAVLQTMADQVAVTIDNAYLFAELRQRLQEMEASQRLYVRERWTDLAPRRISPFYERARPDAAPLTDAALSEAEEVALRREMMAKFGSDEGASEVALVTPISLRGQVIGALGLQETEGRRQWTEDEIALIEAVTDQMALAIENVRLLEETRQLAGWEQTLSDITARFSRSLDTETLLQTAIQELGDLLQVDEVSVHIGPPAGFASAGDDE